MISKTAYQLACMLYAQALRPLLVAAVDDPDHSWDDWLLGICDNVFNYKE
jgi:hypothetical protein